MALADVLKVVAPILASALGGPLAGAAVSFMASKLGVTTDQVEQTITAMNPDEKVKLKQIDDDFQLEMSKQGIALQLAQIGVDQEEAKSINWFIAGARPAAMWSCVIGLLYQFAICPIGHLTPLPPETTNLLLEIFGGLAGLRTVEKYNDVESNR